jgi:hypothetical protein
VTLRKTLPVSLLLLAGFAGPLAAAPITFNTALPVAKGESVLRVQARYVSSTDDPGPLDRNLRVWAFPLVGAYGITGRLSLFGIVPVLDKELRLDTPAGRASRGDSGLGDTTLLLRYTAWKRDAPGRTLRIAPFVALEVPTGDDDEEDRFGPLPPPLQLGSGSWDPSIGVVVTRQKLTYQIDASAAYTFNTEANGFEFGDAARLDISYQHRLRPRELGAGVPAFIYGVLESTLLWRDRNRDEGVEDPHSGGATWFLTPGIQYVTVRTVIEAGAQIPVVQNLNGDALKNDYMAVLSARVNF